MREILNESHFKKAPYDSLGVDRHTGGCLRGSHLENERIRQRRFSIAERLKLGKSIACGGYLRAGEHAETGRSMASNR